MIRQICAVKNIFAAVENMSCDSKTTKTYNLTLFSVPLCSFELLIVSITRVKSANEPKLSELVFLKKHELIKFFGFRTDFLCF